MRLLHGVRRQVGEAGLRVTHPDKVYAASGEDIAVIAVQAARLLGNRPAGNVDDTGKQLASNLEPRR